jgi:serine-type D-Ala-D-Ala carboxypeptidase (penicillin-binding protein 5/6)
MTKKKLLKKYFEKLIEDKNRLYLFIALVVFSFSIPSRLIYDIPDFEKGRPIFREIDIEIPDPEPYPVKITETPAPYLSASSYIVVDVPSKAVIIMKNPDLKLRPASTTKMMTALVAADYYGMEDVIYIAEVEATGQVMGLYDEEQIMAKGLFYGALVYSGNDAAFALSDNYEGGREKFIEAMNQKVSDLKLEDTHFTNPAGLDLGQHYSTVHDLALIGTELIANPQLKEIVGTKEITVTDINGEIIHELQSTNQLLGVVPGVIGIKTGWTENAGECLVTYVEREGKQIILVLLGSYDRFGETSNLIDWVFDNHEWQEYEIPEEEY